MHTRTELFITQEMESQGDKLKVLVTGSHGFIGSYICTELLQQGYEVIGVDNFSKYGKVTKSFDSHKNFTFFHINVEDLKDITDHLKDVDYIVAGAAMIGGISYFHKYAYDLLATNERILASTFDVAINLFKNYNLKRILVMSSSMVFENTEVFPTPESEITRCPPPLSTYGFQKLSFEYFCKRALEHYDLPYQILRPFKCGGVGEDEALGEEEVTVGNIKMLMSHVLPDLIYKAFKLKSTDSLPILGSGDQVRHYTNGSDIARGIRMALESKEAINEDFNISSPLPTTVGELGTLVWDKVHGTPVVFEHFEPYKYDVQYRSPDVSKAQDILGFKTKIGLDESIDEVIAWMRKQHG